MLRDITIGQYYPSNSIIHKLDPRVKLFWTLIYIISLFLGQNILIYTIAGLFLFACIRASKVPVKFILRGLKAVFMLLMFSVIFNIFLTDGEVLFQIWKIRVTKEGIYIAAALSPQYTQYILLLRRKTTCGSIKGLPQNLLKLNSLSSTIVTTNFCNMLVQYYILLSRQYALFYSKLP